MVKIKLFLCFLVGSLTFVYGQLNVPDSLEALFYNQLAVFPQEKIYLHIDKPYYIAGETIWFRTHLVDAVTHVPAPVSRYVYVELFNMLDTLVTRIKIRNDNDAYHGHLDLPDDLPAGDYTLRAYTYYMRNLDEHYFNTRQIRIGNLKNRQLRDETAFSYDPDEKTNMDFHFSSAVNDFDLDFYPEGGALLTGCRSRVAFKALMSNGLPANIAGIVCDRQGNKMDTLRTSYQGMGYFMLLPEEGMSYHVICTDDRQQTKRFDLPEALHDGYTLSVTGRKDKIDVMVSKAASTHSNEPLYLLAHTRGRVLLAMPWEDNRDFITFSRQEFPSGALHFVLFNASFHPVSERLVFINNDDQAQVSCQCDPDGFAARSLVHNRITLTGEDGQPLSGSFSVAVTADSAVVVDTTVNILTQLLLTSDLRGHINNPAAYFEKDNVSAAKLDLLMMTQGWRRYDVAALAQGRPSRPATGVEFGPVVSGRVKRLLFNRPPKKTQVTIVSSNEAYFDLAVPDDDGHFSFNINEQPENTSFIVYATSEISKSDLELLLDEETFPERTLSTVIIPDKTTQKSFEQYMEKMGMQQSASKDSMWTLNLSEVTVSATIEKKPPRQSFWYSNPSNSIVMDNMPFKPSRVSDLLQLTPGVTVRGNSVSIRGQGAPLIVVDDVIYKSEEMSTVEFLESLVNVYEIEQIDVLKDAGNTAVFGTDGANGVIMIFTKRGVLLPDDRRQYNLKAYMPLGYQQPTEFYAPKYDTPEKRNQQQPDLRTTIHWQPVVQTDSQGAASFEFYTADEQTPYTVIIEGVTDDGRIIRHERKLFIND